MDTVRVRGGAERSGNYRGAGEIPREKAREKTRGKFLALIAELPTITTAEVAERIGITAKGVEWSSAS